MTFIEWTENLSVGIEEFDSHHKCLLKLINKLNDSIINRTDNAVIGGILTELTNYTLYHFFAEENAMKKYEYPDYEIHRNAHLVLTEKTLDFLQDEHHEKRGRELLAFLKDWLAHHILEVDKTYTSFFKGKGFF